MGGYDAVQTDLRWIRRSTGGKTARMDGVENAGSIWANSEDGVRKVYVGPPSSPDPWEGPMIDVPVFSPPPKSHWSRHRVNTVSPRGAKGGDFLLSVR